MAYFANGSEGDLYVAKYCERCKHWRKDESGEYGCPIWDLHLMYNYEREKSRFVRKMLDKLIPMRGLWAQKCSMFMSTGDVIGQKKMFDE